jgi:5-methylcytosine-specific restriction endonuclease McrA
MGSQHVGRRARTYDDVNQLKCCASCQEWKAFDLFAKSSGAKQTKFAVSLQAYCRQCASARSKEWAQKNPEAKTQHVKNAYWRDPQKYRDKKNLESAEKRDARNANHRAWRKANLEKVLLWNRLRKMKLRVAGPEPRTSDIVRMAEAQGSCCTYCAVSLTESGFHIDHKTPVSRGGTNETANLQLLCPTCNMKKGSRTHDEYMDCLAATIERLYGGKR